MKRKLLRDLVKAKYRNPGDAIEGERVIAQARKIGKATVAPGTSAHKVQETILKSNVLCVIDKAFTLKEGALKLKRKD